MLHKGENMADILPPNKPRLSTKDLEALLDPYKIDRVKYPLLIVGIRGYYFDTMGKPGENDRGIYDDAIVLYTSNVMAAFNANCDPSKQSPGMASLKPGFWPCYRFDLHHGKVKTYDAICQRSGPVTVIRDGTPSGMIFPHSYREDTGMFGINIHKGGFWTTSSEGCQTLPTSQWDAFYSLARSEATRIWGIDWKKRDVAYVLLENPQ